MTRNTRHWKTGARAGELISNHVRTVAIPGLGTGVGRIPSHYCALQVRRAIEEVVLGDFVMPSSWAEASERHQLMYTTEPRNLQYPAR